MEPSRFEISGTKATIRLNPAVYNLEMAYSTAYVFLDRAWVMFDGDPKQEIAIKIEPKKSSENIEQLCKEFCNELVSITNYFNLLEKNKDIIQLVMQRALFSASPSAQREAEIKAVDNILSESEKII